MISISIILDWYDYCTDEYQATHRMCVEMNRCAAPRWLKIEQKVTGSSVVTAAVNWDSGIYLIKIWVGSVEHHVHCCSASVHSNHAVRSSSIPSMMILFRDDSVVTPVTKKLCDVGYFFYFSTPICLFYFRWWHSVLHFSAWCLVWMKIQYVYELNWTVCWNGEKTVILYVWKTTPGQRK